MLYLEVKNYDKVYCRDSHLLVHIFKVTSSLIIALKTDYSYSVNQWRNWITQGTFGYKIQLIKTH